MDEQKWNMLFDLHTHTIASGHAYSSLLENISCAKAQGMLAYGFSDHTEKMPGTMGNMWFTNFKVVPKEIEGLRIVCGAEVNILDEDGTYDLDQPTAKKCDYLIASLHTPTFKSLGKDGNTETLLNAMKNPYVKIIGHPDDDRYPIDAERVAKAAAECGVLLELNNSSLRPGCTRIGGPGNDRRILKECMKYGTRIVCGTDSHICFDVGCFDESIELLEELNFPRDLVANVDLARLDRWILVDR